MRALLILFLIILVRTPLESKETIIIFSCSSGGGHIATANALSDLLCNEFEVKIFSPQDDLFPLSNKLYNYHLSYGHYQLLNTGYYFRELVLPLFFLFEERKITQYLEHCVGQEKPVLLISVVPYCNQIMASIADRFHLPFLIVTSDNDICHWIYGLKQGKLQHVHITLGRDLPAIKQLLLDNHFQPSQIKVTGLAIRPDFYETKDKTKLCQELQLPLDRPKILLMFGGSGSPRMIPYIETINHSEKNVHMIACIGKNRTLAQTIRELPLHNQNTITVVEYTKRVSDYMAVSDLLITKAGPGTIEEGFALELPILIDETQDFCVWEKMNAELVKSYKVGTTVEDLDHLPTLLHHYLRDNGVKNVIRTAYKEKSKNNFPKEIKKVIYEIVGSSGKKPPTCMRHSL